MADLQQSSRISWEDDVEHRYQQRLEKLVGHWREDSKGFSPELAQVNDACADELEQTLKELMKGNG